MSRFLRPVIEASKLAKEKGEVSRADKVFEIRSSCQKIKHKHGI